MRVPRRGIHRERDGGYSVRLPREERDVLRSLPGQLRELMEEHPADPSLRRLFPPAYADDADADREYGELVRGSLRDGKLRALEVLERTAGEERLTEEELEGWLAAVEDLRLTIGTRLDVTEDLSWAHLDPGNPDAPLYSLYAWLSWLQEQVVEALASGLPGR